MQLINIILYVETGKNCKIFYAILCLCCNSMQFYLKKGYFSYYFHENNNFKKHEIAIKILII